MLVCTGTSMYHFEVSRTALYRVRYVPWLARTSTYHLVLSAVQTYDIIDNIIDSGPWSWYHAWYHTPAIWNLKFRNSAKDSRAIGMITYALESPQAPQGTDVRSKWSPCLEALTCRPRWRHLPSHHLERSNLRCPQVYRDRMSSLRCHRDGGFASADE